MIIFVTIIPLNTIFWIILQWHQNRVFHNSTANLITSAKETVLSLIHAATWPNIALITLYHLLISFIIVVSFFREPITSKSPEINHKGGRP